MFYLGNPQGEKTQKNLSFSNAWYQIQVTPQDESFIKGHSLNLTLWWMYTPSNAYQLNQMKNPSNVFTSIQPMLIDSIPMSST